MSNINNCNIHMSMASTMAAEILAEVLLIQAKTCLELARSLKPTDACAIKIVQDEISLGGITNE